jgi:hypothetical protein
MDNNMKSDIIVRVLFVALGEPAPTLLYLLFTFHVIIFSYFNKLPKAREGQGEGHFEMVKDIEWVGGKESGRQ